MSEEPFFFTWSAQHGTEPFPIEGGSGSWVRAGGERWLDLAALTYQVHVGHGCTRVIDAVRHQAATLCVSMPSAGYAAKRALAEKLLAMAPEGFSKVFFTLGGAEANENALKLARLVTGRYKAVSRYRSYHGATMGALTLSGDWRRPPLEPGIPGVVHVDEFHCPHCPHELRQRECTHEPLTRIPRTLELEGDVGAVFLEPVVGGNGVLIPPRDAMARIRAACDEHGALLVCDEVLTGFGRTGTWFAYEHFGVEPDMITLGKALTGGYGTLGAVLVHERVARHFDERLLPCGLTGYAHPLAVAAAQEAMAVCEDEALVERAAGLEPVLKEELAALADRYPQLVRQSRCIGLLSATDLDVDEAGFARILAALRGERVLVHAPKHARSILLSPPLCISGEELREGVARIGRALDGAEVRR